MTEQDRNIIAYCGLNCFECFVYTKTISEAAKALRREMRAARLKNDWAEIPFLGEYEPFKKTLDSLAGFRCNKVCRDGGGNPWCKIRKCVQKKGFEGCWECADFNACNKLWEKHLNNLKKMKKVGIGGFITAKPRRSI